MYIPKNLTHKPIIGVDYRQIDENAGAGDAQFLSIGKSTWNPNDISAKVIRRSYNSDRWSRQSEELPLWRVLDLAILLIAQITGQKSSLDESVVSDVSIDDRSDLNDFLQENMEQYLPRMRELSALLRSNFEQEIGTCKAPNVFSFATSELSQDAVLCYIFSWADDKYLESDKGLCEIAKSLLSRFTRGRISEKEIHKVEVGRQWKNIDIWVEINDDAFLVVEDKKSTTIHDNQLERYKEIANNEYKGKRDLLFAYFKTDNEPNSRLDEIKRIGYEVFTRADVLEILRPCESCQIIADYVSYLEDIENKTQEYKTKPVDKWNWYQWQGFFKWLEDEAGINVDSWDYVSNPSGGFLGLWWHFKKIDDNLEMYLQFEQQKLCIKIAYSGEDNDCSQIRYRWHDRLMKEAKRMGLQVEKPSRFGKGTYMTIGVDENIFKIDGLLIDMNDPHQIDSMKEKLYQYERLVDRCTDPTSTVGN